MWMRLLEDSCREGKSKTFPAKASKDNPVRRID